MKKREEHKKKKWQKPEFRMLKFSQTYNGTATWEHETSQYIPGS